MFKFDNCLLLAIPFQNTKFKIQILYAIPLHLKLHGVHHFYSWVNFCSFFLFLYDYSSIVQFQCRTLWVQIFSDSHFSAFLLFHFSVLSLRIFNEFNPTRYRERKKFKIQSKILHLLFEVYFCNRTPSIPIWILLRFSPKMYMYHEYTFFYDSSHSPLILLEICYERANF